MRIVRSLTAWTGVVLVGMTTVVFAQNGKSSSSQGGTPNGAPFQQIESQFAQMYQRMAALEAHVAAVETSLQSQINSINASVAGFQTWVGSVNDAITALNNRNAANEAMIAALQGTVGSLQASLVAVQANLTSVQTQLAGYANTTSQNTAAIVALQTEANQLKLQTTQLQTLIATHTGQIATLDAQIASTNQFLANMKGATCSVGQVVNGVQTSGGLTCVTPPTAGGGGVQVTVSQNSLAFAAGAYTFTVNCPGGYSAVGGGYDGVMGLTVVGSYPHANTTSWIVKVDFKPLPAPASQFGSLTAYAKCVK
jgi:peptidoglycan hydrolase CwlO-like protein